jgi:hypothetical protein
MMLTGLRMCGGVHALPTHLDLCVSSQKAVIFMPTAVRTINLTCGYPFRILKIGKCFGNWEQDAAW